MKKYNVEEKTDIVILTICPNCGWFWVKENENEIVCKNCYENLKNQYVEKYNEFDENKFLDWVKEKISIPMPNAKITQSDSGLLRVRDVCWGCKHTQSVVFYSDRKYWQCCKDGSKNLCLPLMKIINLHFNSLLTKPIKLQRTTKFYKTQKGRIRVVEQNLNVLGEMNDKIDLIKIKRGLKKWL
jgi:hypothetical protein